MNVYVECSSEVLRAMRGQRSQRALARRLGYRANPITDWENGRSFPTVEEALRVGRRTDTDWQAAFRRLLPHADPCELTPSLWLNELRGSTKIGQLAHELDCSRHTVSRWLTGKAQPRLPDFFQLVDLLTGRLHDFVDALVGIESVPVMRERFATAQTLKNLALERPISVLLLRFLETRLDLPNLERAICEAAEHLGLEREESTELVELLSRAGVIRETPEGVRVVQDLFVDTATSPQQRQIAREFWSKQALDRLKQGDSGTWFAYNVVSVSREDSERIEKLLRRAFREVRTIVGRSKPEETVALLTMQMSRWSYE